VDTLLNIGLMNALVAALLALLVTGLAWVGRARPAVVHGLWLLVLLKLVTPPLWFVPTVWTWAELPQSATPVQPEAEDPAESVFAPAPCATIPADFESFLPVEADDLPAPVADEPADPPPVEAAPAEPRAEPTSAPVAAAFSWQALAAICWLTGSFLWWATAGLRLVRFRRCLRHAQPADHAVHEQVRRLARRLGLGHCPQVDFVAAPMPPLLWAVVGPARLLLPAALWDGLDATQRDTLLVHELAHLRRGDHWVRRLELVVLGLYWWHPAAWWARRQLQEAEEQCCDAWVVWALPAAAATYAQALVRTIVFLSKARTAVPLGASGIGQVSLLKRRLDMILNQQTPKGLSPLGLVAFVALAMALLPLLPRWSQAQPPPVEKPSAPLVADDEPSPVPAAPAAPPAPAAPAVVPRPPATVSASPYYAIVGRGSGSPEDVEAAQDEVELLKAQLESRKADVLEAEALLHKGRRHLDSQERLAKQRATSQEDLEQARSEVAVLEARLRGKQALLHEGELRLKQASRRLTRLRQAPAKGVDLPKPALGPVYNVPAEPLTAPVAAPSVHEPPGRFTPAVSVPIKPSTPTAVAALQRFASPDRLQLLEKRLDELTEELKALKQELRSRPRSRTANDPFSPTVATPAPIAKP
jgi:beta-lactamase regulating signal transducer with metallopeptidase domain